MKPDNFLVLGARAVLENLRQRNSSSLSRQRHGRAVCPSRGQLLHIARILCKTHLRALDDYRSSPKKMVIERILRENNIPGEQLLAFGDGYVEIRNTKKSAGGRGRRER